MFVHDAIVIIQMKFGHPRRHRLQPVINFDIGIGEEVGMPDINAGFQIGMIQFTQQVADDTRFKLPHIFDGYGHIVSPGIVSQRSPEVDISLMPALPIKFIVQQTNVIRVKDNLVGAQSGRYPDHMFVAPVGDHADTFVGAAGDQIHEGTVQRERAGHIRQCRAILLVQFAPLAVEYMRHGKSHDLDAQPAFAGELDAVMKVADPGA